MMMPVPPLDKHQEYDAEYAKSVESLVEKVNERLHGTDWKVHGSLVVTGSLCIQPLVRMVVTKTKKDANV